MCSTLGAIQSTLKAYNGVHSGMLSILEGYREYVGYSIYWTAIMMLCMCVCVGGGGGAILSTLGVAQYIGGKS